MQFFSCGFMKGIWWIMFCTYVLSWEICKFDVNEMIEYFLWYCAVALALWVSASCSDGWALHWSCCVDLLSLAQTSSKSAILNFGEYCWEMGFFPKYILSKWYFWWQNVTVDFSVCKLCFFEKISTKVRKILPFFLGGGGGISLFLMQKTNILEIILIWTLLIKDFFIFYELGPIPD